MTTGTAARAGATGTLELVAQLWPKRPIRAVLSGPSSRALTPGICGYKRDSSSSVILRRHR
jgi:hypothetical protein